jgi:hypothetical protein
MVVTATLMSAIGSSLTIYAAWVLYQNATPDYGHGTVPVLEDGEAEEFFPQQRREIENRRDASRKGFGILLIGSVLQMVGTLLAGFSA